ncbi:MAG: hypothetical protein KC425_19685 [Anaerolineales bacterium]|nr:hypothetical protein [Anaerolineales bacterium]
MNRRQFLLDFPMAVAGAALALALRKPAAALPPPPPCPVNGPLMTIPFAIGGRDAPLPPRRDTFLPVVGVGDGPRS